MARVFNDNSSHIFQSSFSQHSNNLQLRFFYVLLSKTPVVEDLGHNTHFSLA